MDNETRMPAPAPATAYQVVVRHKGARSAGEVLFNCDAATVRQVLSVIQESNHEETFYNVVQQETAA